MPQVAVLFNRGLVAAVLVEIGEAAEEPLRKALEENRIRGKHQQNQARRVLRKLGSLQSQGP